MARALIRKDQSGASGEHPWHFQVEWPEPEDQCMDFGSVATMGEALEHALAAIDATDQFELERRRELELRAERRAQRELEELLNLASIRRPA